MTNEQHPLDDLLHSLMNNIPITKDQAQEAVKIEFLDLQEHFGEKFVQQLYLIVLMNSYVDRRFSSEEYADLQNERMLKLATILEALLQIFKNNPQSFTGNCEILQVRLPGRTVPSMSLVYNHIEAIVNVPKELNRLSL
jgi:hypothetical protein